MTSLQNKLQALQIESLKFVGLELTNLIAFDKDTTQQEQQAKTKEVFLYVKDAIMRKFYNFHNDVQKVLPIEQMKLQGNFSSRIKDDIKDLNFLHEQMKIPQKEPISKKIKSKHELQGDFICTQCNKGFQSNDRLSRHIVNKHKYSFPCSSCKICFEDELTAWIHQRIVHYQFYPDYQCNHCDTRLSDTKAIRRHLLAKHYKNVRKEFQSVHGREPQDATEVLIPNEFFTYQRGPYEEGIKKTFPEPKKQIIPKQSTSTKNKKKVKSDTRDYNVFQSDSQESFKIAISINSNDNSQGINEYIEEKSDYLDY